MQTLEKPFSETQAIELIRTHADEARHKFIPYCQFMWRGYEAAPHLKLIAEALERVERGECKRLIITAPPRHGKSEEASKLFSSWALGRDPDRRIILTSYAANLSYSFSRSIRDRVEESRYRLVFDISTDQASRAVDEWNIQGHKGGMLAAGVGGPVTGYGANIFIIDDPVKNRQEAESKVYRERIWEWYRNVARTRLEPGAAIIIMMTRWHQQDLVGKVLANEEEGDKEIWEREDWECLDLPAEAEKNDPLGRKEGEALWPARYDEKALAKIRNSVGSRVWTSLYQGHPQTPGGQHVKREWIRWYEELPPGCVRGGGIDTATSKEDEADNMAFVDVCKDEEGFLYCDDVFCEKVSVTAFAKHVSNQHRMKGYMKIHLESNNAGEAVKQRIDEVGKEDGTYPPVDAIPTSNDKVVRLFEFQHLIENGTIRFRKGNAKVAALVNHMVEFPQGEDDDIDGFGFGIKAARNNELQKITVN